MFIRRICGFFFNSYKACIWRPSRLMLIQWCGLRCSLLERTHYLLILTVVNIKAQKSSSQALSLILFITSNTYNIMYEFMSKFWQFPLRYEYFYAITNRSGQMHRFLLTSCYFSSLTHFWLLIIVIQLIEK